MSDQQRIRQIVIWYIVIVMGLVGGFAAAVALAPEIHI